MIRILFSLVFISFFTPTGFAATETVTVVFLGDSLTEGYGIAKENAYPALVEKKLLADGIKIKALNAGISGSTSASAVSRLTWLLKSKPQYLFLALGANDGLRGVDVKATKKNLKDTIQAAKKAGVKVWLAGMKVPPNYGAAYTAAFEKMYPDLAKEEDVQLLPFLLDGIAGKPELNQPDAVHPNEKGHVLVADLVYRFMKERLK